MSRIEGAIDNWATVANTTGLARSDAYDALCWILVTSSGEELRDFCWKYWASFDKVPTPLIVLAARLLANRYRDDEEIVSKCKNIFAFYCDPSEEEQTSAGL